MTHLHYSRSISGRMFRASQLPHGILNRLFVQIHPSCCRALQCGTAREFSRTGRCRTCSGAGEGRGNGTEKSRSIRLETAIIRLHSK
eukprot:6186645-Pleurochrysis_carterae.AAC.2